MFILGPYWTLLPLYYESEQFVIVDFYDLSICTTIVAQNSSSSLILVDGFGGSPIEYTGFLYYFVYNYFCYIVPFFIGLHFTYLDYVPFLQAIVFNR